MMYWIITAWVMGLIGSTHCIGMCGPLAMALPISHTSTLDRIFHTLIYNLGRVSTYALYGTLLGVSHQILVPQMFQHEVSMLLGTLLLVISIYYLISHQRTIQLGASNKFYQKIASTLGKLYQSPSITNLYAIGLLNGLLPCGLVYMALATAFTTGTVFHSITFMIFFGLGTLPLMWSISFFAHLLHTNIRNIFRYMVPYIYALTGLLLIARGLGDHNPLKQYMHLPSIYCSK